MLRLYDVCKMTMDGKFPGGQTLVFKVRTKAWHPREKPTSLLNRSESKEYEALSLPASSCFRDSGKVSDDLIEAGRVFRLACRMGLLLRRAGAFLLTIFNVTEISLIKVGILSKCRAALCIGHGTASPNSRCPLQFQLQNGGNHMKRMYCSDEAVVGTLSDWCSKCANARDCWVQAQRSRLLHITKMFYGITRQQASR